MLTLAYSLNGHVRRRRRRRLPGLRQKGAWNVSDVSLFFLASRIVIQAITVAPTKLDGVIWKMVAY